MKALFSLAGLLIAFTSFSQDKTTQYMGGEPTELEKRFKPYNEKAYYFIKRYNNAVEYECLRKGMDLSSAGIIHFGMKEPYIIESFRDFNYGTSRKEMQDGKIKEVVVSIVNKQDELLNIVNTRTIHFVFAKDTLSRIYTVYTDVSKDLLNKAYGEKLIRSGTKYYENDHLHFYELSTDKYGQTKAEYTKTTKANSPADIWQKAYKNLKDQATLRKVHDLKQIDPSRNKVIEDMVADYLKDDRTMADKFFNSQSSLGDSLKIVFGQDNLTSGDYYCSIYPIEKGRASAALSSTGSDLRSQIISELRKSNFSRKDELYVSAKGELTIQAEYVNSNILFEVDKDGAITYYQKSRNGIEPVYQPEYYKGRYEAMIKNANLKKGKYTASRELLKVNGEKRIDSFTPTKGW